MAKKEKNDSEKKAGGGKKLILIVILALVVIGASTFGGVYYFMLSKDKTEEKVVEKTFVLLEETSVNLNKKGTYFKGGIALSYDEKNSDLEKEITNKKIQLQDTAMWYLKTKSTEDFDASKETELKKAFVDELNKKLESGKVVNVYISTGSKNANFQVQ